MRFIEMNFQMCPEILDLNLRRVVHVTLSESQAIFSQ